MTGLHVAGTGSYVPSQIVTNDDMAKIVDTSDEWIRERTGIQERRLSKGETTSFMAAQAAGRALEDAGIPAEGLDLIIACSVTPDYCTPSLSCIVQKQIGASSAFCFDLNAACSGFIYALDAAYRYLATGGAKTVMIVCSELLSRITDFTDRSTCVLFGDAAAAVVLTAAPGKLFASELRAEGALGAALACSYPENPSPFATERENGEYRPIDAPGHFLRMAGRDVYRFATRAMPESIEAACAKAGISPQALDLIVPHQANIRIVRTAMDRLGIGMDKVYTNLDRFGNTSSASIPLCLDELRHKGRPQAGQKVALSGFGAGLTYGAVVMEW